MKVFFKFSYERLLLDYESSCDQIQIAIATCQFHDISNDAYKTWFVKSKQSILIGLIFV